MSNSNIKSDPKSIKLEDIGSTNIDPATEGKQDATIAAIESIDVAKRSDGGDVEAAAVGDRDILYTGSFKNVGGQQIHIVGDGDKYVVSNAAEGEPISSIDAVPIAGEDSDGNKQNYKIESNGSMPVNIQDQTTDLVDLYLSKKIADITITTNTTINTYTVTFDCLTTPVAGNLVCLKEGTYFAQAFILSVVDNGSDNYTATLDSPLEYAFTTAGGCSIREHDLAVDGSTVAQEYIVSPLNLDAGTRWDIVRVMIYIEGSSAMDDGLFGDIAALTRGLIVRKKDGVYKNLFNCKTNGEFAQRAYDVRYTSQARLPSGTGYSMTTRRTFGGQGKNGVVIRIENDEQLQALVQDDLTGLDHVHVIAQGHVVGD